jgi:thiazole synthase ThiGH ThiG subunit
MAVRVSELARAGLTPDWMPGAVPRCVPVDIKRNRHGDRAVSIVVGTERVLIKGKWRSVEVRACPVTFRPDAKQIDAARRRYDHWWQALDWVRDGLTVGKILRDVTVTTAMPKMKPWTN